MEFSLVMEQPTDPDGLDDVRIASPAHDRNAALSPFLQGSDERKMGNAQRPENLLFDHFPEIGFGAFFPGFLPAP